MKRRIWKTLISALLVTALLVGAMPVSAASVSTNYNTLVSHINEYGQADEDGYMTLGFYITVEGGTVYFFLRNQSSGVQFQFVARGSEAERTDVDLSFNLTKYGNTFPVKFQTIYYTSHTFIDKVDTSVSVNRTTLTIDSEYSVRGSTHISAEDASLEFNYALQLLCLFWDSYFIEAFGFGMRDLGFTSYCYHDYANECDPDCSKCGETRETSHSYGDWANADEANHQQVCSVCGDVITGEHEWGPMAPGSYGPTCQEDGCQWYYCTICNGEKTVTTPKGDEHHGFSNWQKLDEENHTRTCQFCGEEDTAPHSWGNGVVTQIPTEETTGIITYTCSDCSAIKTEEIDFIPGDIDTNGVVNRDDVIALLLHVSMPTAFPISIPADFNGDGAVTRDDVIQLLLHVSMPDTFPLTN